MPDEDQPDPSIWLDEEALAEHWLGVKERRGAPAGTESVPDQEMMQNEYTKGLR